MSQGEQREQGIKDILKERSKCRIPQRLTYLKHKPMACKPKANSDQVMQIRPSFAPTPHPSPRRNDRDRPQLRKPTTIRKKPLTDNVPGNLTGNKHVRPVITVPIDSQNQHSRHYCSELPDQETIRNLELESTKHEPSQFSGDSGSPQQLSETTLLVKSWQQYKSQFDELKNDLAERQKNIVKLYVNLQNTHHKMVLMGKNVKLPSSDDLNIMNVGKLTPDQLLRLCAVSSGQEVLGNTPLVIDVRKLHALPSKIIATCEQTLIKRKEIIDWFVTLKSSDKGIPMFVLDKKINEFTAENEMLRCTFEQARMDLLRELNEMIDFIRKTVDDAVALQLRSEEQTYQLSELNSQKGDLLKRIQHNEAMRPSKGKIEELEKELREEKSRKCNLKKRLTDAEGQIKIGEERASQLEAALEQSRTKCWSLERTVQQVNNQNQKLQSDFDKELNTLTKSIRENTIHLEEIGIARDKLQSEKEDLEKRLEQLSQSYNESLETVKAEMVTNLAKLMETEKKYQEEAEEKTRLLAQIEFTNAKITDLETRNIDLDKKVKEYKVTLETYEKELESTKHNLELAQHDMQEFKTRMTKQSETIKLLESNLVESLDREQKLKLEIKSKDECIEELEKKHSQQANQLQESEIKMNSYEQQLSSLKSQITQLQQDFGEFENLDELHAVVNEQRAKLLEATQQNEDLVQALQKKDVELQEQLENLASLDKVVQKKDCEIKILSEKDIEQTHIIQLLRNNLEMRTQADEDLTQQIAEKQSEITSLTANLETRKQQISQLEKIILALEDENRKSCAQRKKDQELIAVIEKQLSDYEVMLSECKREISASNLDSIMNLLEEELESSIDPHLITKSKYMSSKNKFMGDNHNFESHTDNNTKAMYQPDYDTLSAKLVMGDFVKKSLNTNEQFKGDLGRKEAITNINTQKRINSPNRFNIKYITPVKDNENTQGAEFAHIRHKDNTLSLRQKLGDAKTVLASNLAFLNRAQIRDEKTSKMFKLAGHRL